MPNRARFRATSRRRTLTGLAFASPWLAGFALMTAVPLLSTAYFSLTDYGLFDAPKWIGATNYEELARDPRFRTGAINTLYLTVVGVPLALGLALLIALALNRPIRGRPLWRAAVYLPTLVPVVVATYVWRWLLNGQYGYVNILLGKIGLGTPEWLKDPAWTKPAIIIMGLWTVGGTTVIYLAALGQVPQELYEAASIDGAGPLRRFRHVTWPVISPVTLFQLVVGVIVSLQLFTQPYLLAQDTRLNTSSGGPADSLLTYPMYLFQTAFVYLRMGYASAQALVLFMVTVAFTAIIIKTSRRWVHYDQ